MTDFDEIKLEDDNTNYLNNHNRVLKKCNYLDYPCEFRFNNSCTLYEDEKCVAQQNGFDEYEDNSDIDNDIFPLSEDILKKREKYSITDGDDNVKNKITSSNNEEAIEKKKYIFGNRFFRFMDKIIIIILIPFLMFLMSFIKIPVTIIVNNDNTFNIKADLYNSDCEIGDKVYIDWNGNLTTKKPFLIYIKGVVKEKTPYKALVEFDIDNTIPSDASISVHFDKEQDATLYFNILKFNWSLSSSTFLDKMDDIKKDMQKEYKKSNPQKTTYR